MTTVARSHTPFDRVSVLGLACALATLLMVASYALAENSVTSTMLGIAVILPGPAALAVVFGFASLRRSQKSGEAGGVLAIAAITIGAAAWFWGVFLAADRWYWFGT